MRLVTVVLIVLLALIQYPLWWGHGGWLRVHDLQQQLVAQQQKNVDLKLRNDRLEGEVRDLQNGTAAIEERARYELGMVKNNELFVQFVDANAAPAQANANSGVAATSTRGRVSAAPLPVVPDPAPRVRPSREKKTHKPSAEKAGKPAVKAARAANSAQ